jgi:hypothetical protein
MPGGDRTGPMGMGAMSGRGAGACAGNINPAFMNVTMGRGQGRGFGRGVSQGGFGAGCRGGRCGPNGAGRGGIGGFGRRYASFSQVDEKEILVNQERVLKIELESVSNRLASLESAPAQ